MSNTTTEETSKNHPQLRYCFTLDSSLSVPERERLAKGPLGTRVNVIYEQGQVFTDPARLERSWSSSSQDWSGLTGKILSGADIFLVRPDSVLMLDGRVTIRSDDGVLIDAVYKGALDLVSAEKAASAVREAVHSAVSRATSGDTDAHDHSFADFGVALRSEIHHLTDAYLRIANVAVDPKVAFYCALAQASQAIRAALPHDDARAREEAGRAIGDVIAVLFPPSGADASAKNGELKKAREHALSKIREKLTHVLTRKELDAIEKQVTIAYRAIELDVSQNFVSGFTEGDKRPVQLTVTFETSSGPWSDVPGEDMSWVSRDYVTHQAKFSKYRRLVRRNFVAFGELSFEKQVIGSVPVARHIRLCVYELAVSPTGGA
jgi:hypothetical protein